MSFNPDLNMTYTQEQHGKVILFRLEGSLMGDSTQQQFKEAILNQLESGYRHFILDLSAVRNVNSSGLGSLITLFSRTRSAGGEFILAAVPPNVRNLLHITRLDTVFPIRETLQDALQSIQ